MTASGPFAMGPALAGSSARRVAPRSNFTPLTPMGPGMTPAALGSDLSRTAVPSLKKDPIQGTLQEPREEEAQYSDPDEGVEIVDMENVRQMDWMAPESLLKERNQPKRKVQLKEGLQRQAKGEGTKSSSFSTRHHSILTA